MSWPTRDGDLQARRFCPAPGPTRGNVVSRWTPAGRDRIECAVIHEDGRIAVGLGKSVQLLAPDLRPLEKVDFEGYVRDVIAVPSGFLAVERHEVRGVGGATVPEGLAPLVAKYPFGARLLADGTMLIWDGSDFARVDPGVKKVLNRYRTASGMSSTRHVAVGPDGTIWSAMAMSWSSEDDPTEYYAAVAAFALDGRLLREWSYDDGMPTSTGFDVQAIAAGPGLGIVAETGAVLLDPATIRTKRFLEMSRIALRPDGAVFGTTAHEITRTNLDGASIDVFARSRDDEYVRRLAVDGAGNVYAATTAAVLGFDARGTELFRIEPFDADTILLGEGYLIAVGMQNGAGLIRVH